MLLTSRLETLQKDYADLIKTNAAIEKLNSDWSQKYVQLNEELGKLQVCYNFLL